MILLTVSEAASELQLSRARVRQLAKEGRLPFTVTLRGRGFSLADLRQFQRERERNAGRRAEELARQRAELDAAEEPAP